MGAAEILLDIVNTHCLLYFMFNILQGPSVLILEIPTYANARLVLLEDTVMIMWMTVPPFLVLMVELAKMELMIIPAPALQDTMGRTVAPQSANVNTTLVTMGLLAMKETTVMCVSVLGDMADSTVSFCSPNSLRDLSLLTSLRSTLKDRTHSFLGLPCVLE